MNSLSILRRTLHISLMVFTITFFFSCKNDLKKDLNLLYSHPIILNTDKMQCVYPMLKRDSCLYHINDLKKPYKLIIFFDSIECMSCATEKLHNWDNFLTEVSSKKQISCFFIFSPKKEEKENLHTLLIMEQLEYPVYIDYTGTFIHENPHIPPSPMMHTFLINNNGKVIFVGDPRRNMKLNKLFYKTIS